MTGDLERDYADRRNRILEPAAVGLERLLRSHLEGLNRIDRVSARAKGVDRFLEKAAKRDEHGKPKYRSPLSEIQDQIGTRVIVFYLDDVEIVAARVRRYFNNIEARDLVPESEWEFGYFGRHYILALPEDVLPKDASPEDAPRFFELQVKTLFQHAWSESNHDLGYKPEAPLTSDQKRRLAFTAAQAWGADRMFSDLCRELQG